MEWPARVVTWSFGISVALAVVFAGVGFVEYATKHLFLNQKLIESNQFESYFRVNSLFFDPNIYGRFLALVMIGLAAMLLWPRRNRDVAISRRRSRSSGARSSSRSRSRASVRCSWAWRCWLRCGSGCGR